MRLSLTSERLGVAALVVAAWLVSLVVRVLHPMLATMFVGLDSAMLAVVAFLFSSRAIHHNGDDNGRGSS